MTASPGSGIWVAMCTYNGERYLREQLDSIAKQTALPSEFVNLGRRFYRLHSGTVTGFFINGSTTVTRIPASFLTFPSLSRR
jgi:hypothetical protein